MRRSVGDGPRRCRPRGACRTGRAGCPPDLGMKHLLVTNDFPPKIGGIQSYLWELWRRLPAEEAHVLATAYEGAEAFDAASPVPIHRTPERVLLPTRSLARRIDALA